jgi:hypothetical protein
LESDDCPFANLPERKRTQWALTISFTAERIAKSAF